MYVDLKVTLPIRNCGSVCVRRGDLVRVAKEEDHYTVLGFIDYDTVLLLNTRTNAKTEILATELHAVSVAKYTIPAEPPVGFIYTGFVVLPWDLRNRQIGLGDSFYHDGKEYALGGVTHFPGQPAFLFSAVTHLPFPLDECYIPR